MTYNSGTQERVNTATTNFTELKVLELSCEDCLNVLGIDGEVKIATEIANNEGGYVAVLDVTDVLHPLLSERRQGLRLVGGERGFQVTDSEGVGAWVHWHFGTTELSSFARVLPGVDQGTDDM